MCIRLLPLLVICTQITSIAMLLVHHLEEVLQVHHFSRPLALGPPFTLLPPLFRLVLGRILVVGRRCIVGIVGARSSRNLAGPFPLLARSYRSRTLALFGRSKLLAQGSLFGARLRAGRIAPFRLRGLARAQ